VVVPDSVANPPPGSSDRLSAFAEDGWGVIVLCPPGLVPSARAAWLEAIVDQVVTFLADDYEVALVRADDEETQQFVTALRAAGKAVTRVIDPMGM
jgi:hypothetical protein